MLRAFGLTSEHVVARVSDRRILHAFLLSLGVAAEQVAAVYGIIDKLERTPPEVSGEKLAALGVGSDAIGRIVAIADVTFDEVRQRIAHGEGAREVEAFADYLRYVPALLNGDAGWVRLDLSIVRGLAYYTGIVFELFDRSGEFRAICGGGRYDTLLQSLGGADMPALGFGMGDVVLGELLRARGLLVPPDAGADLWIAADEAIPPERVMAEAARRRGAGQAVEYALRPQSLGKQRKAAQASGARAFLDLSNDGHDGRHG